MCCLPALGAPIARALTRTPLTLCRSTCTVSMHANVRTRVGRRFGCKNRSVPVAASPSVRFQSGSSPVQGPGSDISLIPGKYWDTAAAACVSRKLYMTDVLNSAWLYKWPDPDELFAHVPTRPPACESPRLPAASASPRLSDYKRLASSWYHAASPRASRTNRTAVALCGKRGSKSNAK